MIQERRKERKTEIVKEKKDLLDFLMDMYDEETGTKMEDEELRAQVMYFVSLHKWLRILANVTLTCRAYMCMYHLQSFHNVKWLFNKIDYMLVCICCCNIIYIRTKTMSKYEKNKKVAHKPFKVHGYVTNILTTFSRLLWTDTWQHGIYLFYTVRKLVNDIINTSVLQ